MKPDTPPDAAELRRRAEEHLQSKAPPDYALQSAHEVQRLLGELQIHQVELEMQNEELRNSRAEVGAGLARYSDFYDFAPMGFVSLERNGAIIQVNLAAARLLNRERAQLAGDRFELFVAMADRPVFNAFLQQVSATGTKQTCEVALAEKGRPPRNVQIEATLAADGQECRCVVMDITERKQAEDKLKLAASVFTHANEGIMITDADGSILDVNDTFTRITGYSREEALGQNPRMLKSDRQGPEFYAAMWHALTEQCHWHGEIWNRHKDGEVYAELLTISAVRDATGKTQHFVALFSDITPMKEQQRQLEHIAHYDSLTGLPNRVLLADRLQHAIVQSQRRGQSLAVAYIDLDGFKAVNDTYGHNVGDELLIAISQRMKEALREGDTLSRIGGDEFIAVLVDLEQQKDCEPVLARLLQAAADPATVGDAVLQVSASIGVTLYPQDEADADLLLRHADQAMYVAKQAGKNRYQMFDVNQDAAVKTLREGLERIRHALDRQEFVLHYQPKVNMKTGEVIGAEALIRWRHPERGLLQPAVFLPIIENLPISVELGEWVIETALTQMTEWRAAGLDIPVSVNVGTMQLQQGNFVPRLAALLAAHPDVQPSRLELEIRESSALEDMAQVSEVMHACRALGVRFALDDFGTGHSPLTNLKFLPAKLLKIDQSFVRGMLDDPDDLAMVEVLIGLATAFGLEVIAEGVETGPHGELLISLGCELAQGYGIARPMSAVELPGWVASWHPRMSPGRSSGGVARTAMI